MLNALFPRYTYRRLALSMLKLWVGGGGAPYKRMSATNWAHFKRFSGQRIDCNVCGRPSQAFYDFPDLQLREEHRIGAWRETVQCNQCGATMRHRMLAWRLLRLASQAHGSQLTNIPTAVKAAFGGLRVLDTDSFSPISSRARALPNYVLSSFLPDQPFDQPIETNRYNVNLERMGFADASFDVVLTSDVAEHIRDIDAAHAEIARILKPGGHYVFTVPYDSACSTHHILVDTSGVDDVPLVPKQMHGDPLTGGILAYRVFGRGLFEDFARLGMTLDFHEVHDEAALIIDGDVFDACKPAEPLAREGQRS